LVLSTADKMKNRRRCCGHIYGGVHEWSGGRWRL